MAVKKKYGQLGRGLDALISTEDVSPAGASTINEIALNLIDANPKQPRREFDEEAMNELSDSISKIGIIQPITLRKMEDGRYQIIAGERRWRASLKAGLPTIPAYIRTADDENVMEMALVENIQRQDLNPIEIALAYQHLIDQYGLTQERLSERVGKNRATIANFLRLLKLPAPVQVALQKHMIDTGHARALLALDDPKQQVRFFKEIQHKGYSVRKVEELIKEKKMGLENPVTHRSSAVLSDDMEALRQQLAKRLGMNVKMKCSAQGKGHLTFDFANVEQLQQILNLLMK